MGGQQKRRQEHGAELPISLPVLAAIPRDEGRRIYEYRARPVPLDVERRGVFEYPAVVDARFQQTQMKQRRIFEHREGPLVWPCDEIDRLMLRRSAPTLIRYAPSVRIRGFHEGGLDHVAIRGQIVEERLG